MKKITPTLAVHWTHLVVFGLVWSLLFFLNYFWSRDVGAYRQFFYDAAQLNFADRLIGNAAYLQEFGFYFIQSVMAGLFPFGLYLALIIFASLGLKYFALLRVNPNPNLLDILPYLCLLAFLHEGAQIRIGLALSIALFGVIAWANNRPWLAIGIVVCATAFHSSVAIYLVPILLLIFFRGKLGIIFALLLIIFGTFLILPLEYWQKMITSLSPRYALYFSESILKNQNSSGLFQYYFVFFIGLTGYIFYYFRPSDLLWKNLRIFAILSGIFSVLILQSLSFSVVIASRLADSFLLPIALVMGATLSELWRGRKLIPLMAMLLTLILYGLARAYISFRPMINPAL